MREDSAAAGEARTQAIAEGEPELTSTERRMLEFESAYPWHSSRKAKRIADRFSLSAAAYYLRLSDLLARPTTLREFPGLVFRLGARQDRALRNFVDYGSVTIPGGNTTAAEDEPSGDDPDREK